MHECVTSILIVFCARCGRKTGCCYQMSRISVLNNRILGLCDRWRRHLPMIDNWMSAVELSGRVMWSKFERASIFAVFCKCVDDQRTPVTVSSVTSFDLLMTAVLRMFRRLYYHHPTHKIKVEFQLYIQMIIHVMNIPSQTTSSPLQSAAAFE